MSSQWNVEITPAQFAASEQTRVVNQTSYEASCGVETVIRTAVLCAIALVPVALTAEDAAATIPAAEEWVATSYEGSQLLWCGSGDTAILVDYELRHLNLRTGTLFRVGNRPGGQLLSCSHDGRYVWTDMSSHRKNLWWDLYAVDVNDGKSYDPLPGDDEVPVDRGEPVSPNNTYLLVPENVIATVILPGGTKIKPVHVNTSIVPRKGGTLGSAKWYVDESHLVVIALNPRSVFIQDVNSGATYERPINSGGATDIALSPDGRTLYTLSPTDGLGDEKGEIYSVSLQERDSPPILYIDGVQNLSLSISRNGLIAFSRIIKGSIEDEVKTYGVFLKDTATGAETLIGSVVDRGIGSETPIISPDGRAVAIGGSRVTVFVNGANRDQPK